LVVARLPEEPAEGSAEAVADKPALADPREEEFLRTLPGRRTSGTNAV
jgi:hypothetical protein